MNSMKHGQLTEQILCCSFDVMNELGAGFYEKLYKKALIVALAEKGLKTAVEVPYKVFFRGSEVGHYIADILVEGLVLVELKTCSALLPEHSAQVIN